MDLNSVEVSVPKINLCIEQSLKRNCIRINFIIMTGNRFP